jgi:Uncharacterized protein conserved in bacteria (DUF2272)
MMNKSFAVSLCLASLFPITAQATDWPVPNPADRAALVDGQWQATLTTCPAPTSARPLRQRLVDVAAEEWARFGFPVIDNRASGLRKLVRPKGEGLVPDALNPIVPGGTKQALRLGFMEDDAQVRPAIAGYWTAVPDQSALAVQSRLNQIHRAAGWSMAWSAAFVSYVVCTAGVESTEAFQRSDSHFVYVDQAIANARSQSPTGLYRARDISTGLPNVGDLLCADRAANNQPSYQSLAAREEAGGQRRFMHCDLVVSVAKRGGYVAVIGGNVVQAVSMTLVGIVPGTRSSPARVMTEFDDATTRPWFAVLELQDEGTRASLAETPAVQALGSQMGAAVRP